MKSTADCYRALLEGETLDNSGFWCYLNDDGELVDDKRAV